MNGREFKALRKMLNFTQIELAQKLGLDRTSIGNYEKDPNKEVPATKALALQMLVDKTSTPHKSEVYLEKNGVRFDLPELVDHFVKNAEAYYNESEYLKLFINGLANDNLIKIIKDSGLREPK